MKIIFNTSNFPKWKDEATTPFIFTLAKTIKKKYDVHILAPHADKSKKYEKWNNIKIFRYQYFWPSKFELLFNNGGALVNLRKNPLKYLLLIPFFISQTVSLFLINFKNKYDMVHSHWLIPQGLSGIFIAKLFSIPHIISVHGSDLFSLNNKFLFLLKKIVLNNSKYIICNSYFTKKELINRFGDFNNKIKVIPVPIEENHSINNALTKKLNIKANERTLVFIGRVVDEKGLGLIIRSLSYFDKSNQNIRWRLIVGGDGKDLDKFKKLAQKLNINNKIEFIGWISKDVVAKLLSIADLFIGISLTSKEGGREAFGLTYLESIMMGVPLITSKDVGLLSYFTNDEIKKLNIKALKRPYTNKKIGNEILHSLKDSGGHISKLERKKILKRFTQKEILKKYSTIYEENE